MEKVGRIINLGSSSAGNAFYLEFHTKVGEKFNLLLECGFEYKDLLKRFIKHNIDVLDIDAVLVSHLHKDHSASLKDFHERGFISYAPKSVYEHYGIENGEVLKEYKKTFLSQYISILPIPLEHYDSDRQVENFGYIITIDNEYNILFVIDTKYIPQDLSAYQFNMIIIEANYLEDNIKYALNDARLKKDTSKLNRYQRLYNSHFSLENLARTFNGTISENAKPFDLSQCDIIFLTHLSSNKQTNERYYTLFLDKFLQKTANKTKRKDTLKVVAMLKEGGFS